MPDRLTLKPMFRLAAVALAALAVGCVTGQPTTTRPAGGALSVDQLNGSLVGSSVVATRADGSGTYCAFHSNEAQPSNSLMLYGTEGSQSVRGLYRIESQPNAANPATDPGFVCYSYPDAGVFADCRMVRVTGAEVAILSRSGQPYATGQITPGNACGAS